LKGTENAEINMLVEKNGEEHQLTVYLEKRDRIFANFKIDGVKKKRKEAQGFVTVVIFDPTDVEMFTKSPEARRKYLNMVLSQKSLAYLDNLANYDSQFTTIFETDLASDMLKQWSNRPSNIFPIQADIENLPFEKNSFDIIISSFSLQWIFDFEKNFSHFFSLLKPNGIFAFCLPTDETLQELKSAKIFPINDFPHSENLRLILKKCGFVEEKFLKETSWQKFLHHRQ
jgi:SAM-dependent methyltransferase